MLRRKLTAAAITVVVVAYTFFIRTRGIADHFLLLGDQIRDWSVALRPFSRLPLAGPPRMDGGVSLGPIFYWVLWGIRVALGPFFHNLPHAGGIGLALAESLADGVLLVGVRRASGSWLFAAATVLIIASSPFDLALSSAIWNPVLSVTFAKATIGLLLAWHDRLTPSRRVIVFIVAWLTAQAHTPGMPFALGIIGWIVIRECRRTFRDGVIAALDAATVVIVLQLPYLMAPSGRPTGMWSDLTHPSRMRLFDAAKALGGGLDYLVLQPWAFSAFGVALLIAALVLLVRLGPFAPAVAVGAAPLASATAVFAMWQGQYDFYWFMTLMPSAVLTIAWLTLLIPAGVLRQVSLVALLAAAVAAQPSRVKAAPAAFRLPEYAAIVRASETLVARREPIRRIEAPFLPPTSNAEFVFTILGGELKPDAPTTAVVSSSGDVTYTR